jgi:protein gp37
MAAMLMAIIISFAGCYIARNVMKKTLERFKPVHYFQILTKRLTLVQRIKKRLKLLVGTPKNDDLQKMLDESW